MDVVFVARLLLVFRRLELQDAGACVNQAGSEFSRSENFHASAEFTVFHQMLAGIAVLALVMLGVGGTIYKLM